MRFHPEAFANATPISMLFGKSDRSPARLNRSFREAVESEIERLIDLLDAAEPDADFEPYLADQFADDREEDDCDDEDSDHSGAGDSAGLIEQERGEGTNLGATEDINQAESWRLPEWEMRGGGFPVTDGEPSLGWSENHGYGFYENQADSPRDDREDDAGDNPESDPAEAGIGDDGGLSEQMGRAG